MKIGDRLKAASAGGTGTSSQSGHYKVEVNKGSLNVGALAARLNQHYEEGYELDQIIEQAGNTVMILKRRA